MGSLDLPFGNILKYILCIRPRDYRVVRPEALAFVFIDPCLAQKRKAGWLARQAAQ
jgi:hypothetical protein